jgi:hypothetical protein
MADPLLDDPSLMANGWGPSDELMPLGIRHPRVLLTDRACLREAALL